MIALFDLDSLIYSSVYRVVDFSTIRDWFNLGKSRDWMEKEIVHHSVNRLNQMIVGDKKEDGTYSGVFAAMEDCGIDVTEVEYYITTCRNSFRKRLFPSYKANRKRRPMDKWVSRVRKYIVNEMSFAIYSDVYEADDLIADRASELEFGEYVIVSIDKDLKQIGGVFFNYYKQRVKINGEPVLNDFGEVVKEYKGLSVVENDEAQKFFWKQMLMGDSGDGVSGIRGIGPKKAEKIISGLKLDVCESIVRDLYNEKYGGMDEYWKSYHLLKLGSRDIDKICGDADIDIINSVQDHIDSQNEKNAYAQI